MGKTWAGSQSWYDCENNLQSSNDCDGLKPTLLNNQSVLPMVLINRHEATLRSLRRFCETVSKCETLVIHVTSGVIHGIRPVGVFRCQVM